MFLKEGKKRKEKWETPAPSGQYSVRSRDDSLSYRRMQLD